MGDDAAVAVRDAVQRTPTTEVALQVDRPLLPTEYALQSVAATRESPVANRSAALWRASRMFAGGIHHVRLSSASGHGKTHVLTSSDVSVEPSACAIAIHACRIVARYLWRFPRRIFYRESWHIAYRRTADRACTTSAAIGFRLVQSPSHLFYADPFVIKEGGEHVVFFEHYDRRTRRASIAAATIDESGLSAPEIVVERDYHLSYPCVFCHGRRILMIPETGAIRQVQLLAPLDYPRRWVVEAILLEGVEAYDPTLFHDGSRFWLFVTVPRLGVFPHEELYLYSSERLHGPYGPHPRNPVVSDIRSARPAGALFWEDGRLIRPSQDCSRRYGFAIQLNEVTQLTPTAYDERPNGRIEPHWLKEGLATHTANYDGTYEVLDAVTRVRRFQLPLQK
jgi:hypothetical protein